MPIDHEAQAYSTISSFDSFVDEKIQDGTINESQLDDSGVYESLSKMYSKQQEKERQDIVKSKVESLSDIDVNTVRDLKNKRIEIQKKQEKKDNDGAFAYSIDQAQKTFGGFLEVLGDSSIQSVKDDLNRGGSEAASIQATRNLFGGTLRDYFGSWAKRIGQNIVKQQEEDIRQGNYQPTYKGGLLEQKNLSDIGGWIMEKLAENSVSGGVSIAGVGAAVATRQTPLLSKAILGSSSVGSSMLAIGDLASELKDKGVYDEENASQVMAIGTLSGAVDMIGASKILPKNQIIRRLFGSGAVDSVAKEIVKNGAAKGALKGFTSEGATELLQEGINVAYAASQGADYGADELLDRGINSFVVGGVMGAGFGSAQSHIQASVDKASDISKDTTLSSIWNQVKKDQKIRSESAASYSSGRITGLSQAQTRAYIASLIQSESSGNQRAINKYGYSGLYQFGASALADIGLVKIEKFRSAPKKVRNGTDQKSWLSDKSNWNLEGGLESFLSSREIQDKAIQSLTNLNIKRGLKSGAIKKGAKPEDYAAYAKAAHLVGHGGADDLFLKGIDDRDANRTSAQQYANEGREAVLSVNERDGRFYGYDNTDFSQVKEGDGNYSSQRRPVQHVKAGKESVPIKYDVVEASSINPDLKKGINQFRDRSRSELSYQVDGIANDLDYDLVGPDSGGTMELGSPVLSSDGVVIAGNGRSLGIKKAYDLGKADDYKSRLMSDLDYLGVDKKKAESLKNPVLIRRFTNDVDVESMAILSNESSAAAMSPLEQAKVDSKRIKTLSDFNPDSEVDLSSNDGVFKRLIANVPQSQRNALVDGKGQISQEGKKRAENAVMYMAYGDSNALAKMVESTDTDNVNITKGMINASSAIAEMRDRIDQGILHDVDISKNITEAVDIFSKIKADPNNDVNSYLSQKDAFNSISPETEFILRKFEELKRSPKKITEFLAAYPEELSRYGNPKEQDMFATVTPEKLTILESIKVSENKPKNNDKDKGNNVINNKKDSGENSNAKQTSNEGGGNNDNGGNDVVNAEPPKKKPIKRTVLPIDSNYTNTGSENKLTKEEIDRLSEPDEKKKFKHSANILNFIRRKIYQPATLVGEDAVRISENLQAVMSGDVAKYDTSALIRALNHSLKKEYKKVSNLDDSIKEGGKLNFMAEKKRDMYHYISRKNEGRSLTLQEKTIADEMRKRIDKLSLKFMDVMASNISIETGFNVSVQDLVNADFEKRLLNGDFGNSANNEEVMATVRSIRRVNNNIGTYITRTYKASTHPKKWNDLIRNSDDPKYKKIRRDALPYFVSQVSKKYPEREGQFLADSAKQEMYNFLETSSTNDEGIMMRRSDELDSHPELRRLLGENTDVDVAYTNAISRMHEAIGVKSFYNDLYSIAKANGMEISSEKLDHLKEIKVNKGLSVRNPFYGKYATPELASFIERATGGREVNDLTKKARMLNGLWQSSHTVFSAPTQAANMLSALPVIISTMSSNGLSQTFRSITRAFSPVNKKYNIEATKDFVKSYGFNERQMTEHAIENQLTSGGASGGEVDAYIKEGGIIALAESVGRFASDTIRVDAVDKALTSTGKGLNTIKSGVESVYHIGDSIPKLSIYFNEVKRLNDLHLKFGEDVVPKGTILQKASSLAKIQAPQYSRIPEIVDDIRKFPIAGQFVAFQSQMYQTMWNQTRINTALARPKNNAQFIKNVLGIDINALNDTPELQKVLIRKLRIRGLAKQTSLIATTLGYQSAVGLAIGGIASAFGEIDDISEEESNAISKLMPDYYRYIDKQYVGKDSDGNPQFINTSRLNMYGGFRDSLSILKSYYDGDNSGENTVKDFVNSIFSPFYQPTFAARTVSAFATNQDDYKKAIIVQEDGLIENTSNVFNYLKNEMLTNGTSRGIESIYSQMVSEKEVSDRSGRPLSYKDSGLKFLGFGKITFDPNNQLSYWLNHTNREVREVRNRLSSSLKSYGEIADSDIEDSLIKARKEHQKLYSKMIDKINSARLLGLSDKNIMEAVNLSRAGKRKYVKFLSVGLIPPFTLGKIGDNQSRIAGFKNTSEASKKQFSRNYKRARDILNNMAY